MAANTEFRSLRELNHFDNDTLWVVRQKKEINAQYYSWEIYYTVFSADRRILYIVTGDVLVFLCYTVNSQFEEYQLSYTNTKCSTTDPTQHIQIREAVEDEMLWIINNADKVVNIPWLKSWIEKQKIRRLG